MKTIEKIRLTCLCLTFFDKKIKTKFDMDWYALDSNLNEVDPYEVKNECGTTTCFAGRIPLSNEPELKDLWRSSKNNSWLKISHQVSGFDENIFYWLFSDHWPNSKKFCLRRAWHVLNDKSINDYIYIFETEYKEDKDKIIRKLSRKLYLPTEQELRDLLQELRDLLKVLRNQKYL